jgi:two-component system LytT family response regulator
MPRENEDKIAPGAPIRTVVVDDEPLARENLRIRLSTVPDFELLRECATGREAVRAVTELSPDLLFLDIRMPDMDGLSVVEQIDPDALPVVVFVTAHDQYALEAFRVHALDYLLKPFDEARFAETLEACRRRVAEIRELGRTDAAGINRVPLEANLTPYDPRRRNPYLDRILVKSRGRIFFVKTGSIDWIEACADYITLHVGDRTWLIRRTMAEMEERLDPRVFARVSRSAIVNLEQIQQIVPSARGELFVCLAGKVELKLTRGYRAKLEALLGDRL